MGFAGTRGDLVRLVGVVTFETLVPQALLGRTSARDKLARALLPIAYATAIAATRDRHAAEDVAQEAILRVFASLRRVKDPKRLGGYVVRIARNCVTDRARRGLREQVVPEVPAPGRVTPPVDASGVLAAWHRLPEDERLVIWLSVQNEVPLRQIARWLDISRSSAHRLHTRALERLRKELGHVAT